MARRSRNSYAYPVPRDRIDAFKAEVMRKEGYRTDPNSPNQVKYEVAGSLGIPLTSGYNGHLRTEDAGRIGGQIGGSMVREMIRMAKQQLENNRQQPRR